MYLNKAFIFGNLTRDPEMKALPSGSKITSFSLATNRTYKDNAGNKKEDVEYHNVVVFGRQAETCAQYLSKGQGVLIEGRIQTRSWEDKTSGEKKYRTEIVADAVQFGPKVGAPTAAKPVESKGMDLEGADFGDIVEEEINVDDIPF